MCSGKLRARDECEEESVTACEHATGTKKGKKKRKERVSVLTLKRYLRQNEWNEWRHLLVRQNSYRFSILLLIVRLIVAEADSNVSAKANHCKGRLDCD